MEMSLVGSRTRKSNRAQVAEERPDNMGRAEEDEAKQAQQQNRGPSRTRQRE